MGPVQILVVGFGEDAQFKGAALEELRRLQEADIVRLIDLLFVRKLEDGTVEKLEIADVEEVAELGALAGALLGLGAAGEEGAEVGAAIGAEAMAERARSSARATPGTSPTRSAGGHGRRHRAPRAPLGDPAAQRHPRQRRRGPGSTAGCTRRTSWRPAWRSA